MPRFVFRFLRWPKERAADRFFALGLASAYVLLLLGTVRDLGYARDEGFYFHAARSYEAWFDLLLRSPQQALQKSTIDAYWSANHEHPALMKSLFALSHKFLFSSWHVFTHPGTAYRFPGMLVSSMAVALVYSWGSRVYGRAAGLIAAVSLGMMPRVFYHSHLACFDMPVAAMWLVTTYAYWCSLRKKGLVWPVITGVLYGLLLNTKHNAWLLPGALAAHFVLTEHRKLWQELKRGRLPIPSVFFAMLLIGPPIFYAGWPWIWHDTLERLSAYARFHLQHEYYNMEFLGRTYWKPPMPRLYAPLMTAATVPAVTLALFGIGLFDGFRARRADASSASDPASSTNHDDRRSALVLWVVCMLASYAPWLSTDTPIFGGTKHWITAYPFLCLFAAGGFAFASQRLRDLFAQKLRRPGWIEACLALSVTLGPVVMTLHSHPWGLSAYTPLVGGAPGAASLGLNRTFWGYTTGSLQAYLNEHVPAGARVYVHDTALQSWELMQQDGRIRSDLSGTLDIASSDVALYHHEPHMGRVEYQIWVAYGTVTPTEVRSYDGVPVVWLYERPSVNSR
jgi:4-amino-4-deoxy-L-arabinose transferase-like glycosyltransferase